MKFKTCSICKISKTIDSFYIRERGYIRNECKPCLILKSNDNYKKNFEIRKISKKKWAHTVLMPKLRFKLYGISPEQYNFMLEKQDNKCAICKEVKEIINVDHCHSTGKTRGLLCQACNLGLGNFRDKVSNLEEAVKYLIKHSSQSVITMAQQ